MTYSPQKKHPILINTQYPFMTSLTLLILMSGILLLSDTYWFSGWPQILVSSMRITDFYNHAVQFLYFTLNSIPDYIILLIIKDAICLLRTV